MLPHSYADVKWLRPVRYTSPFVPAPPQGGTIAGQMRSLFLLGLGGTFGIIVGVLLVTIDPDFGDSSNGPPVGIGTAGVWMTEGAIGILLQRELEGFVEEDGVVSVDADIQEDGFIYLNFISSDPGIARAMVLDPGVLDGAFTIAIVSQDGGSLRFTARVVHTIIGEVEALLQPVGGTLAYELAAITTTDRRLTLEVNVVE